MYNIKSLLRQRLERLARGRILKRYVTSKTPIYVSPDAQLKYLKWGQKAFDADLVEIAGHFINKDNVIWAVGANVGVFSFTCAHRGAKTVVSLEADVWLCSLLRRTSALQEYSDHDVRILPIAVSDRDGIAEFIIAQRGRASNALVSAGGRSQMGGAREHFYVPTLTLDTIAKTQPKPDFIKVDVEGAELAVLEGAANLMSEHHPTFYAEIGHSVFSACAHLVRKNGYLIFDADGQPTERPDQSNYFFVHHTNDEMQQALQSFLQL
ncbi:FkbM family methyltransferase [Sulfitobacter sp. MOLA879]|uniref:FkbM family methyltransferase n=1 Tax=Sulfitobacter sp. MOLA879 TaxID=3368579 RepID=UPI00374616DB